MAADDSAMHEGWYVRGSDGAEEWQTGPFTWEELLAFVPENRLLPDNLVWHPSMSEWIAARNVAGLFPEAPATPVPEAAAPAPAATATTPEPAAQPEPPTRSSSKTGLAIAAVFVTILLLVGGGLGAWALFSAGGEGGGPGGDGPLLGTAEVKLPSESALIETDEWGRVPANQIGIVLGEDGSRRDAESLANDLGGEIVGEVEFIDLYQVEFPGRTEQDLRAALAMAEGATGVDLAFPNEQVDLDTEIWGVRVDPYDDPIYRNDPGAGYRAIGLSDAWDYIKGSGLTLNRVNVGIVDDGLYRGGTAANQFGGAVDIDIPDADSELANPGTSGGAANPAGSHGTAVATVIGADADSGGTAGIAAPLRNNLRVSMTNMRGGSFGTTTTTPDPDDPTKIAWGDGESYSIGSLVAITRQIERGSTVINLSWGRIDGHPDLAAAYRRFFEEMSERHPNVLFVCSGGNNGEPIDGSRRWPSGLDLPNMITVGALNNDGTTASFASRSSDNYEITLAAPGASVVVGVDGDGNPVRQDGSSFAAPHVAGAAAMLRSINPHLTAGEIKTILSNTARLGVTHGDPNDPASQSIPIAADVGGRILAIDRAVLQVINDVRVSQGLPPLDEKQLKERGVVDAYALLQSPGDYLVRGIVPGTGDDGTGITIEIRAEEYTLGGDAEVKLDGPGSMEWTLALPKDEGSIRVTRTDNRAASVITIDRINISGTWTGTFTFTGFEITDQKAAEEEGCSALIAEQLVGTPFPMTIRIDADEMGSGTAVMTIDASSLGDDASADPQSFTVTQSGREVTFEPTGGSFNRMNATVSRDGQTLSMEGTTGASGSGWKMTAVFTASKPVE